MINVQFWREIRKLTFPCWLFREKKTNTRVHKFMLNYQRIPFAVDLLASWEQYSALRIRKHEKFKTIVPRPSARIYHDTVQLNLLASADVSKGKKTRLMKSKQSNDLKRTKRDMKPLHSCLLPQVLLSNATSCVSFKMLHSLSMIFSTWRYFTWHHVVSVIEPNYWHLAMEDKTKRWKTKIWRETRG